VSYSIRTVTSPAEIAPVISLAEAKAHLRVDWEEDDDLIAALVLTAQDHVERFTARVLTERAMEAAYDGFPCGAGGAAAIVIPRDPITAVTAIAYLDASGTAAELDGEAGDWRWSESAPDRVMPAFGVSWPAAASEAGCVRVSFTAGYDAGLAPASLIGAVKLMCGHLFGNREAVSAAPSITPATMPIGVVDLCAPYRRISI
jgi:uncharacterized phiE125 gp8 family phage protein